MEFIRNNQMNIMAILMGVCASIIFFTYVLKFQNKRIKQLLIILEVLTLIVLVADRYAYYYKGNISNIGFWMVRICNFLVFMGMYLAEGFFGLYVKNNFEDKNIEKNVTRRLSISFYISLVGVFILCVSQFTGLFYTFNEDNVYQRSQGYYICILIHFVIFALQISFIIKFFKSFSKRISCSLLLYIIIPIISAIFQIFFYGISFNTIALSCACVGLFVFALIDSNHSLEESAKREKKMELEFRDNMEQLLTQAISTLAFTIDAKDAYTRGHSVRVAKYSRMIAERVGYSSKECYEIYITGLLHDIGKISVLDSVINKPGKLTDEEFAQIKAHTVNGAKILEKMKKASFLKEGAKFHHERYDGKGYPCGLRGKEIPERARIIAVADAYDAMTSYRSYRDVMDQSLVRQEIWKGAGTQFDPYFAKVMISFIDADVNYDMREKKHMQDEIQINAVAEDENGESTVLSLNDEDICSHSTDIKYVGTFIKSVAYWASPDNKVKVLNTPTSFTFVANSEDAANRIWQSACLIFYSADDGEVDGEEYEELSVVEATGYGWCVNPALSDNETITRKETFTTWDDWMTDCKKGMTHNVSAFREGNIINATIDNKYLSVVIKVTLPEDYGKDVYVAVTGDSCIIEDFQIN